MATTTASFDYYARWRCRYEHRAVLHIYLDMYFCAASQCHRAGDLPAFTLGDESIFVWKRHGVLHRDGDRHAFVSPHEQEWWVDGAPVAAPAAPAAPAPVPAALAPAPAPAP